MRAIGHWLFSIVGEYFLACFDKHDADELRQRTILVVLQKFDSFEHRGAGSFRGWVMRIAHLEALSRRRDPVREQHNLSRLAELPLRSTLTPVSRVLMLELQALLSQCLARLPELEREAVLWGLEGRDDHELAQRYGVTVRAIRTRRFRGRRSLIELMRAAQKTPVLGESSPSTPAC